MSRPADYLYELLPVVYRSRDAEQGYALRALLRVINEQVGVIEDDITQLHENWFIETCEDWVVPYLADLIGYRPVHDAGAAGGVTTAAARLRNRVLVPRREVANTIAFRRRKGTLALLELLAGDVAGWPARAVEFYGRLGWTQHLNHQRLARGRRVDLRAGDALDRSAGPFDDFAHTVDVRRIPSERSRGRYNVPAIALFAWRLRPYSVTQAPARCVEEIGSECYTFSVLGNDTPLFTLPEREAGPTHIAEEINLPVPIRRRAFEERISSRPPVSHATPRYYGPGKSLSISVLDWPRRGVKGLVPAQDVIPADLRDWRRYQPPKNKLLVDPERGRIVFRRDQLPRSVWVTYHYGFSTDMGGGEYARTFSQPATPRFYRVRRNATAPEFRTIKDAYDRWRKDLEAAGPGTGEELRAAVIEIADSAGYEPMSVSLGPRESLQIRAANHARPTLRLLDREIDRSDPFTVSGGAGSRFVLDGVLVTGRGIEISGNDHQGTKDVPPNETGAPEGDLCDVTLRHCTLVPGWELDCGCGPQRPDEPSITLRYTRARLNIEHSVVGAIRVLADERTTDPVRISISDSIVDATRENRHALSAADGRFAFAALAITRSTVVGEIRTHAIELAENCIFMGVVQVARRQHGCIRYSYLAPASRTPRRYHCQPDLVRQAVAVNTLVDVVREIGDRAAIELALERERAREQARVLPCFTSLRYGNPAYCQLALDCAGEIARGADDESEMGAFHDLYQPQRAANLTARLAEYTPADVEPGIIYGS